MATDTKPVRDCLALLASTFGGEVDSWQRRGYERTLAGLSREVLLEAADLLINEAAAGRKFYPMPTAPDVKGAYDKVIKEKRTAARLEQLKNCPHGSGHWRSVIVNGIERMERCECWEAGKAAADRIGAPLQLPTLAGDEPWEHA